MTSKTLLLQRGHPHHRQFSLMSGFLLATGFLVIPLAFLLFAQWPLREWVQAWSREANDVAQNVFAVYVAVAITAASLAKSHLAAAAMTFGGAHRGRTTQAWRTGLMLACVGPWALFILWAARAQIVNSVMGLEQFGETQTPGFFMIKLALGLLLVLVLMEAVTTWWAAWRHKA